MTTETDVVIIGGGVIGICAAYYLARTGRQVTLVERAEICAGSSYGNAGLITPSDSLPLPSPGALKQGLTWLLDPTSPLYIKPRPNWELLSWLWQFRGFSNEQAMRDAIPILHELSRTSLTLYRQLVSEEHINCHYQERGLLFLYRSPESFQEGQHRARLLEDYGLSVEVLAARNVRERVPMAREEIAGGVYCHQDAHLEPATFVRELAARCQDREVVLHTHTEVIGFEVAEQRVTVVHTTRGDFYPQEVVLAAGAWSPEIARDLGLRLPIQPAKGYSITVQRPEEFPEIPLLLDEAKVAVTPMGKWLRFAGTLELAGRDMSINRRRVEAIRRAVGSYLTLEVGGQPLVEIWRGLRPCTPDGLPIIGRCQRLQNLIVAAGHCMLGISMGPMTGKLVAQIATGQPTDLDIRPLRVERFR